MQQQTCITCSSQFDYYKKVATVICSQNHFVCKDCAKTLYNSNSKCPYCLGPLLSQHNVSPYAINEKNSQYSQSNPYSMQGAQNQPAQNYFPQPQNYHPNQQPQYNQQPQQQPQYQQPYQQQPQQHPYRNDLPQQQVNVVVHQVNPNIQPFCLNPRKLGCLLAFFLILFVVSFVMSIQINSCSYYGRYTCFYYDMDEYFCCNYSCPTYWYDDNCYSLNQLQGGEVIFYALTTFSAIGSIITIVRLCIASRNISRMRRNAAYLRV